MLICRNGGKGLRFANVNDEVIEVRLETSKEVCKRVCRHVSIEIGGMKVCRCKHVGSLWIWRY